MIYDNPFIWLIEELLWLYTMVVIAAVVMSWLVSFGVINTYNHFARSLVQFLDALTEPLFRQVRRVLPPIGGLDLSPLIVLVGIMFLQKFVVWAAAMIGI
ncbi:MAG: YggT family protein [Alphaproteobacteria bacterium]|nr:YggT family protein [Alphaproteobacteria bacterium]MBU6473078.1 YggT family protein [Alphaproteobacteria bacterium]MDE2012251.1 YggT family protein [Alphaproteobacteria bacterium]MDE2352710.1 YggT family protein [Alphaproteobacteria bacterium]